MDEHLFTRKIYINNKPLILTNSAEQYMDQHTLASGYLFLTGAFPRNFRAAQKHLEKHRTLGVIIEDISVSSLKQGMLHAFVPMEAAGGVVANHEGGVLMIYRRGKWDLPKGKRDEGESIEDCARREVMEETGLAELELGPKICETYHVYTQGAADILKTTYWYQMTAPGQQELVPQKEENILEAKWIAEGKLGLYMHQSYEAIREVLQASGRKW